jgi:hypothetical protein
MNFCQFWVFSNDPHGTLDFGSGTKRNWCQKRKLLFHQPSKIVPSLLLKSIYNKKKINSTICDSLKYFHTNKKRRRPGDRKTKLFFLLVQLKMNFLEMTQWTQRVVRRCTSEWVVRTCQGDQSADPYNSLVHYPPSILLQPSVHSLLSLLLSSRDVLEKILGEDSGKKDTWVRTRSTRCNILPPLEMDDGGLQYSITTDTDCT